MKTVYITLLFSALCFSFMVDLSVFANTGAIKISTDGHWLEFRGRKVLLVGDSVTQGWQELGMDFDQKAYIDALSARGINLLMLWSYIGIVNQKIDPRIGYDAPEVWPWINIERGFDLNRFNDLYFNRLRSLVEYANTKDIVVLITVHDGWPKTRFKGHPFNIEKGGPLKDRSQYVELADYDNEMPPTLNPAWSRRQKNQYFLERFCDRLSHTLIDLSNVMYEIFNEGEWYNQKDLRAFQVHFLNFFKARTTSPIVVNDDHVGGEDFQEEPRVDVISLHKPNWNAGTSARASFVHFAPKFGRLSAKPYLFSEPVPGYMGNPSEHDGLMRLMWGTALGRAGFVVQNDASFGFAPKAAIVNQAVNRDIVLDLEGHLSRFFNASEIDFGAMEPDGGLASSGVVLAKAKSEYVVYSESGVNFTVDLSDSAETFIARFYSPRTGTFQPSFSVTGGSAFKTFRKPDNGDWVLHLISKAALSNLRVK